ncbi:MAG: hypothetical protein ABSE82_12370 [Nitrososphaerales archaeon]
MSRRIVHGIFAIVRSTSSQNVVGRKICLFWVSQRLTETRVLLPEDSDLWLSAYDVGDYLMGVSCESDLHSSPEALALGQKITCGK